MSRYGARVRIQPVSEWFNPKQSRYFFDRNEVNTGTATVTCDSTAHVKGAWTELIASTSADADYIYISCIANQTGVDSSSLVDIGFGASGSEVVAIGDLAVGSWAAATAVVNEGATPPALNIPFRVSAGTRIAVRGQSIVTGGKTIATTVKVLDTGNFRSAPTSVDVIGTSTATSSATAMSGTANTYVELIASTSREYKALVFGAAAASSAMANRQQNQSLAIGAAGSEVVFMQRIVSSDTGERLWFNGQFPNPLAIRSIPSGSRLAAKSDLGYTVHQVYLIGIPA